MSWRASVVSFNCRRQVTRKSYNYTLYPLEALLLVLILLKCKLVIYLQYIHDLIKQSCMTMDLSVGFILVVGHTHILNYDTINDYRYTHNTSQRNL